MHAFVGKDLIFVFKSLISEGEVYVFTYFGVTNNCGLYHTTSCQFRLFFQARITVLPSFCDAIPLYGIKLVLLRKLWDTLLHILFWLVSIAGIMTGVEGERKYVKDNKLIDMLVIHIENDSLKLNIAVFREMVDRIKGLVASGEQQLPVEFYVVLTTALDVEPIPKANADTYFCDGCNRDVNNVVDRYKLNLLVFDGTTTTTSVVFDKEAAVLFRRTCTKMVKELNEKGEASKDLTGFNEFFLDK
ncbi:hypothetical protein Ahy_A01g002059 [Arachis hypogaea]|uniref:Replication protein A 70 kDa DNA-binding subunit B/D first OB fold domain-containing protein n=1 Tax=Arachis hypogaea TaxID=3818 RepID=A0A445EQH7_ARAHY|nr:hypothetical protein Ahy_A01g002059 [Arachis hypogaea]